MILVNTSNKFFTDFDNITVYILSVARLSEYYLSFDITSFQLYALTELRTKALMYDLPRNSLLLANISTLKYLHKIQHRIIFSINIVYEDRASVGSDPT